MRTRVKKAPGSSFRRRRVAVLGNGMGEAKALRDTLYGVWVFPEGEGRRPFQVRPGTEFELAADWVVLALGFRPLALSAGG